VRKLGNVRAILAGKMPALPYRNECEIPAKPRNSIEKRGSASILLAGAGMFAGSFTRGAVMPLSIYVERR